MASPKPAAIASWPSDRWLVPLTRFCRNRSKARCSASRRRTCERYSARRFCSPISSFNPEPAGPGARSCTIDMNDPRRVETRVVSLCGRELSPDERDAATPESSHLRMILSRKQVPLPDHVEDQLFRDHALFNGRPGGGYGLAHPPFAVEQIEPGGHHGGGAGQSPVVG